MSRADGTKTTKVVRARVEKSALSLTKIVNDIVNEFCEDLDREMRNVSNLIKGDITDQDLEFHILELTNILYFAGTGQENIGIREDICKSIRMEVYTDAILAKSFGTVSEKTSRAELETKRETLVLNIYSRAYKKMKQRVDAGYEMLNSMKKIMNKRLAEMEMSNSRFATKTNRRNNYE